MRSPGVSNSLRTSILCPSSMRKLFMAFYFMFIFSVCGHGHYAIVWLNVRGTYYAIHSHFDTISKNNAFTEFVEWIACLLFFCLVSYVIVCCANITKSTSRLIHRFSESFLTFKISFLKWNANEDESKLLKGQWKILTLTFTPTRTKYSRDFSSNCKSM